MNATAAPLAFITGAATGLGLVIACRFFHNADRIAVIDNDAATMSASQSS